MPTIKYNNQEIPNAKITRFQTQNEFEGNNFNRTARKHTLEGVGVIGDASAFSESFTAVKSTLMVPGKTLQIKFAGDGQFTTYADGAGAASNYDARNGPLPEITVTEIAGTSGKAALLVSFTFTWTECGTSVIQRAEIITTHSLNESGMLRIQRRGFLTISAGAKGSNSRNQVVTNAAVTAENPYGNPLAPSKGINEAPSTPDMYRRLIAAAVPPYFQRVKQEYYVQADQITLAFDIEDVEVTNLIPYPALDGDGSFEYTRGLDDGNIQGTKTFRIELSSNRDVPTEDLFYRCVDIALTKISFTGDPPDMIQSFRISQASLFKRNIIGIEIVAHGTMRNSFFEDGASVDQWLYFVLFASPNDSVASAYSDAYGAIANQKTALSAPRFRFDACELSSTWQSITGAGAGYITSVQPSEEIDEEGGFTDSKKDPIYKTPDNQPDPQLGEDAKKIVTYKSSQSIDIASNCNFFMPMGWGIQYGFQFALPDVVITQTVEMITRDDTIAIPWPNVNEAFIVLSNSVQINDAPPDASGNRLFVVHATRVIKVSVWNSSNTTTTNNPTNPAGGSPFTSAAGTSSLARTVWMPSTITSARNPITGNNTVNLCENLNGTIIRQDYVGGASSGGAE